MCAYLYVFFSVATPFSTPVRAGPPTSSKTNAWKDDLLYDGDIPTPTNVLHTIVNRRRKRDETVVVGKKKEGGLFDRHTSSSSSSGGGDGGGGRKEEEDDDGNENNGTTNVEHEKNNTKDNTRLHIRRKLGSSPGAREPDPLQIMSQLLSGVSTSSTTSSSSSLSQHRSYSKNILEVVSFMTTEMVCYKKKKQKRNNLSFIFFFSYSLFLCVFFYMFNYRNVNGK